MLSRTSIMVTSLETLKIPFALNTKLFEESVSRDIGTEGSAPSRQAFHSLLCRLTGSALPVLAALTHILHAWPLPDDGTFQKYSVAARRPVCRDPIPKRHRCPGHSRRAVSFSTVPFSLCSSAPRGVWCGA